MITIEPGRPKDVNAIEALENEAFESDKTNREQFQRYLKHNLESSVLLVGRDENQKVKGYVLVWTCKSHNTARIHGLAVRKCAYGTGLGEALLESACSIAATGYNCSAIRLEVRTDNQYAMKRYEKSGFRRIGSKERYYADGCAAFSYERNIGLVNK